MCNLDINLCILFYNELFKKSDFQRYLCRVRVCYRQGFWIKNGGREEGEENEASENTFYIAFVCSWLCRVFRSDCAQFSSSFKLQN